MARRRSPSSHRYPRSVRINQMLREVIAEELERLAVADERLELLTVTSVDCDPDLRTAKVLFSSLGETAAEALGDVRVRLQAAVARQARFKRTPLLRFVADPVVATGGRVEEILRTLPELSGSAAVGDSPAGEPDDEAPRRNETS